MFNFRWADTADIPAIALLMDRAISVLQKGFLSAAEITASRSVMGLDTQLIADGTYLLAEQDGRLAGSGGWSARATLMAVTIATPCATRRCSRATRG